MSIDGFCQGGYEGVGRKRVLPTPRACEAVARFGQQSNPPRCSPDLRREVGVVLRMKTGVLVRRCPRLLHNANRCVFPARSALTCRRFVSVFLLCAG